MDTHIFNVGDFVRDEIPDIVNGRGRLRAVLTTYNQIRDHKEGKVATGDANLQIKLMAGGLGVPSMSFMMDWAVAVETRSPRADQIREEFRTRAVSAQETVNQELDAEKRPDLVLMYAGLRGFGVTVDKCVEIRQRFPKAYVAVLACDCDLYQKMAELSPLLANGTLNAAIVTPNCGGQRDMRDILESFIRQWPTRQLPVKRKRKAA